MLTRSEMEEILNRQYDENGMLFNDDEMFNTMTDEDIIELFVRFFPEEKERQELEKSIRNSLD